jgi:hypothetical protein
MSIDRSNRENERTRSEMRSAADEVLIRRFLLGDLSEEDRNPIEDEYLSSPERFEQFLAVENDLVDAYIRGELTQGENRKFETGYLGTLERREKVEFARALNVASAQAKEISPDRSNSFWRRLLDALSIQERMPRWILVASLLGLAAIGSLFILRDHTLRAGVKLAQVQQAEIQHEVGALRQQIAEIGSASASPAHGGQQAPGASSSARQGESVVALSLVPGGVRGSGASLPSLHLPRVQLLLILDQDDYKVYVAELQTADGKRVLQSNALRSQDREGKMLVSWRIPAHAVQPGDYIVQLKGLNEHGGFEDVQSYTFRALAQ